MMCSRPVRTRRIAAFSLLELLMVITILAVLSALIVPSVSGLSRSYQLNSSGQSLLNNLTQARQAALTRGYPVQVRIYKLPGHFDSASASPSVFRAMQTFVEGDPAKAGSGVTVPVTPLSKPVFFSSPVEILDSATYSSVLSLPYTSAPQESLPGFGKNYGYVSFRFKPDGQADLPAGFSSLTMLSKEGSSGSGLPKNFRSFEIDSATGAVREYSP